MGSKYVPAAHKSQVPCIVIVLFEILDQKGHVDRPLHSSRSVAYLPALSVFSLRLGWPTPTDSDQHITLNYS